MKPLLLIPKNKKVNAGKCPQCGGRAQQSTYADYCLDCDYYVYYG